MTQDQSKRPAIRFKEYNDAWEQRKLGELGCCQSGIGFPNDEQGGANGIPFYKVSDMNNLGNDYEMHTANNYVTWEQINNRKWKPITDVPAVIFAKVGAAILLNRKRLCTTPFLIDNNTMAYKIGEKWDDKFCQATFDKLDLTKLIQVGALPSYNASDVENVIVSIPPNKNEQHLIGEVFSNLNNLLTLHQRKYEQLKATKASLLDKMFPKEGDKVPRIRFAGFNEDWVQSELSTLTDTIETGKSKFTTSASGKYEILGSTSVIGFDNSYDYEGDFILTARVGANAGELYRHSGKVKISDNTVFIEGKDLDFLFYTLCHFDIKKLSFGTGQPLVKASELKKLKVSTPNDSDEKKKIGDLFSFLDNLLNLYQRKCDELKALKSALLHKMFV